jgi:hypothetical protein
MKKETIRTHIDNKIIERLSQIGFHGTRQHLLDNSRRFQSRIPEDIELVEEVIEDLKKTRDRYHSHYVLWANKRIIDLYKIEMMNLREFSPSKRFKALLFKEKLQK